MTRDEDTISVSLDSEVIYLAFTEHEFVEA